MKVILTGVTGMVGEGVLHECLESEAVDAVLAVTRKRYGLDHPKLTQLVVKDLAKLDDVEKEETGYDACFYCAGVSSAGMSEEDYTKVTFDTPLGFATTLARLNPKMVLVHVSGASTDGTEKGRVMWARVKGRAENALAKLPFAKVYNFRPGIMLPAPDARNIRGVQKTVRYLFPIFKAIWPSKSMLLADIGRAMIHIVGAGYSKSVLEVADIKELAAANPA
jgi:uncharacterized protein YbjT (DUF2867 family)